MKKIFIFSLFIFFFSLFFVKAISPSYAACIPGTGSTNKSCGGLASYQCTSTNPPPNGTCCQFTYRCENNNCVPKCHQGVSTALCGNKCGGSTCAAKDGTCTSSGICSGEGGSIVTGVTGCISPSICCQFPTSPPPSGGGGGYDCKDSGCVPHAGAGSGQYSTESACSKGCKSELLPGCPVCTSPYYYDPYTGKCALFRDSQDPPITYSPPTYQTCSKEQTCSLGCGCNCTPPKGFTSGALPCGPEGIQCYTAFGPIKLDPASLVKDFFGIVLSISGGIAVLLIILSGYRLIASQGNPEKINEAKEHLTAAIIGFLFVIFSFSILRFIGVDVLGIFP